MGFECNAQGDPNRNGFCAPGHAVSFPTTRDSAAQLGRPSTAGEPILLTTPSSPPESIATVQDAVTGRSSHLERMEADVKAIQQQALATQKTLDQLQAREVADSSAGWGDGFPLAYGVWGLAAVVLLLALAQFGRQWRWRSAHGAASDAVPRNLPVSDPERGVPKTEIPPVAAPRPAPPRTVAVEPEFAEASDSDWGVSHAVELDEPAGFDIDVAASEVARVRAALAQRRQARALEREEDARRARAMTEQALQRAEEFPTWEDSRPFPETLDVASDDAVAPVSIASAPVPFWHRPAHQTAQAALSDGPELASAESDEAGETLPSLDNAFAVKLALAKESAAVDLWVEARELIREVLESGDPELQAQAHALMATIERRKDKSRLGH